MTARHILMLGIAMSGLALLLVIAMPLAGLRAWLAASFLWSGLPFGSLGLLMVMRLTGGRWDQALPPFLEAGSLTLPISFVAFLPITFGLSILYPWASHPPAGFKGVWLSAPAFILRTLTLYLGAGTIGWGLVTRRLAGLAVASVGLLFLIPMLTFALTDWLLSMEPGFHSSGFPLYAMAIQFNVALMVAVLLLLWLQPRLTAALGAIMITLTLISLYLAFTHYIIIWSGNLADVVGWYRERAPWDGAYAVCAVLEAGAFFALVVPDVRRTAIGLRWVAAVILFSKLLETGWLVLPAGGAIPPGAVGIYLLATVGLGMIVVPAQILLLARRVAERVPA